MESLVWCQNLETSWKKSKTNQYLDLLDEKEGERRRRERRGRREEEDRKEEAIGTGGGKGRRRLSFLFVAVENTLVI